jgi:hypothetical protein
MKTSRWILISGLGRGGPRSTRIPLTALMVLAAVLGAGSALVPQAAGAQTPEGRIDVALVRAAEAGIPVSLLQSRVLEGRAKGIPMDRIATAVEARLAGLTRAARMMDGVPGVVDAAQLGVAADALESGVSEAVLRALVLSSPGEQRAVAIAALTHLVQEGTVPAHALERVQAALARGPQALSTLPGAVGPPPTVPGASRAGGPPDGTVRTGPPAPIPAPGQARPPSPPGPGGSGPPGGGPPAGPPGGGGI